MNTASTPNARSTSSARPGVTGTRSGDGPLLSISDYSVHLHAPRGIVRAVDGVSLTLARGRTLAVVGESGSGKSVLFRSLLGLLPQAAVARRTGEAFFAGTDLTALDEKGLRGLRGRRIGLVFQDPMTALNPVLPVWRQLALPLRRHLGLRRTAARTRAVELLDAVGIPDPVRRADQYPVQMSGGMRQRVMIALALSCDPELIVADEPTTALDVTVQAQILGLLDQLRAERGLGLILISHDLGVVADHSDDVLVMYAGRQAERGPTGTVLATPRMPYTRALLDAAPTLHGVRGGRLAAITGQPPDLTRTPDACAFAARCPGVREHCHTERPSLTAVESGSPQAAACWYPVHSAAEPVASGAGPVPSAVEPVPSAAGPVPDPQDPTVTQEGSPA
ncbi:ABC transporter ATP-binding protein [Streptomyces sp. E11-3]|uniref:ABC transporter ATP-binding protein n=1 Tax=Streptomyces sp. E11-3 TaxID=3110112 RepID=UPI00398150F6